MGEAEKQEQSTGSWWKRLEKLRHPNFRRRLEGVGESDRVVQASGDKQLVDHLESELIKMANGDENPAVRDAAFHQVLKWGGPLALGMGVAVGAALLGARAWSERHRSQEEIERILQNPASGGSKRALRVGEEAVRAGKGTEFIDSLLASLANPDVSLKARKDLVAAVNPHSQLGAEFYRNEALCLRRIEETPPEIRDALSKLLRKAKDFHSGRDRLKGFDMKKLH
ncbi:MAG: hypothetical protein Q7R39_18280 [Dehalococcoidia bacterium]|nr:hypothetical protein [Dehalococcoidia bacterium]